MTVDYRPDYESLLDSVSGIVWEGEPETFRFRFVSKQAERILGYPVEAWTKDPDFWIDHLHPKDREWAPASCRKSTASHTAHVFEYRMIAADGRTVWLRDHCTVVVENGRVVSVRGVMVDITASKQADESLWITSERLRTLVSNAPVILFAIDPNGTVTFCEGRGLGAAGIDPKEFIGRPIDEWLRLTPEIQRNIHRALEGEECTDTVEFEERVFQTRYAPTYDPYGTLTGAIGVATDVTEQMRAEQESRTLEAQVQHTQKLESLGVLAGGIAHDFNNLLMTILGNSDLVLADLPQRSPTRIKVERIQRAGRSAADLTKQLLAYSGRSRLESHPLDLSSLVEDMADLLRVTVSKRIDLRCELAENLPPVEGDAAQISQVILNLITNASEALSDSTGTIEVRTGAVKMGRTELSNTYPQGSLREGPCVFLEVGDTGVGMDRETRSKIFDPFFTTKFLGRGLGLATTLGIVRSHRGALVVESERGKGSRFRILLPCSDRAAAARQAGGVGTQEWQGRGTVLVVDDEEGIRELAQDMLERLGLHVLTASLGSEALEILRSRADPVAAVLIDATMPDMSGEEIARALLQIQPATPIVLMSGYPKEGALSRLPREARAGFLQKPFDRGALVEVLRRVIPAQG